MPSYPFVQRAATSPSASAHSKTDIFWSRRTSNRKSNDRVVSDPRSVGFVQPGGTRYEYEVQGGAGRVADGAFLLSAAGARSAPARHRQFVLFDLRAPLPSILFIAHAFPMALVSYAFQYAGVHFSFFAVCGAASLHPVALERQCGDRRHHGFIAALLCVVEPPFVLLPILSILGNYSLARRMVAATPEVSRRLLIFGIACNVLVLCYYKYADFLLSIFDGRALGTPNVPLALSIHDVRADCVPGLRAAEASHLGSRAIRAVRRLLSPPDRRTDRAMGSLGRQLADRSRYRVDWDNGALGVTIFTLGLAKKVLIATCWRLMRRSCSMPPRAARRSRRSPPGAAPPRFRCKSFLIFPAIPKWRSASACCSTIGCRSISLRHCAPRNCSISGAAGTSR